MKHQADRTRRAALPPFGRNPATAPHNGLNSRSRWAATYLGGRSSDLSHAPKRLPTKPRQWQWLSCFDVQRDSQQRVLSPALTAFPLGRTATSGPPSPAKLRKTFIRRMHGLFVFWENFSENLSRRVFHFRQLVEEAATPFPAPLRCAGRPSAGAMRTDAQAALTGRLTENFGRLTGISK